MQALKDKTILITGATDGLGKEVAKKAAQAGAKVLLHGRNPEKGKQVMQEIKSAGNENIFYYNANFASLQAVKEMSEAIIRDHEHVHVLINNAAIGGGPKGSRKRELSIDGYELRLAVNYLAHYLLTQNLLPLIVYSAPARIVHVSSVGQSPIDFDDIMMEKKYDSYEAYCRSKLAQIMYGFDLAEHLKDKGVSVNSLHPASLMNTNMVHDFFGRVTSTVGEGVAVVEYVAFSPETEGITGAYFHQMKRAKAHAQAYNTAARKKLWEISEKLTNSYHIQT
ncbi:MAG: SDR family NAD(P)-dependent oxidoreductase [Flavisolibacter sp.]|nr:SDR family NAD(P)-dependent oxidoreductase [Flavisolibacter sp.]